MFRAREWLIQRCTAGMLLGICGVALAVAADTRETQNASDAAAVNGDAKRGQLLYETNCIACHTTQAHWRDKHLVRSWPDLLYQVSRWQKNAGQNWSSEEINDTAAYLNQTFYKLD
jgi:mono/diheme cytochrome c family protein